MKDLLVGSTGFVGNNLMTAHKFEGICHSTDVADYYGSKPDLCVYAGVPASMVLANSNQSADLAVVKDAFLNMKKIEPKKIVHISSITVYADNKGKNEKSMMNTTNLSPYGANRLQLEKWVHAEFPEALIIRLPALYGRGLKKNFLYDLWSITPKMLKPHLWKELAEKSNLVRSGYTLQENGFYVLNGAIDSREIKAFFESEKFNALSFTDSRSKFQFYNLGRLWTDIEQALQLGLTVLNLTVPPVSAQHVYEKVTGKFGWRNELALCPYDYDLKSLYADLFGGNDGYLCSLQEEMDDICEFMRSLDEL